MELCLTLLQTSTGRECPASIHPTCSTRDQYQDREGQCQDREVEYQDREGEYQDREDKYQDRDGQYQDREGHAGIFC